ncbi:MAG: protein-L-isoaspartate(D-aspartate) O-methyltransferase [Acidobacteria bacterium]|nr:protein-L-isoaspartate(D-aspartate) O-methyltransferase [Acidobacteriota bacterium]
MTPDIFDVLRRQMVSQQIRKRGIHEERLLDAMSSVPRHEFVPPEYRARAYEDKPVPIDTDTSISQPYIVALMTEALDLDDDDAVLEIGTGSGYHTAVLSRLARRVYTIEIDPKLAQRARRNLSRLGYRNVEIRVGDGYQGWPSAAPFDAIILTAAPPRIPRPLMDQLRVGGRMVVSVGEFLQDLVVLEKQEDGSVVRRELAPVRLPEMTGEVQGSRAEEPPPQHHGQQ